MKSFKVIAVLILVFFSCSTLFSQGTIKKGNHTLSGSVSYSYSKNAMDNGSSNYTLKAYNFGFSPAFGFFISNNLLVGGNISFNYNELNSISTYPNIMGTPVTLENKSIRRHFALGPDIRYYFTSFSFFPFLEIVYNYSKELASDQYGNIFNFTGGINYFISKSVALEPFIGYSIGTYKNPDQDLNTFSFGIRVNYFILKNE
ncbi:MAG: hypothetical protein HND40_00325 [Ignavibacteriota bacterium]|nr:hypothetical protein [Ignavibacteriota bacterium]MCO6449121.1 hypothetical protein [Ignavibacterium album]MCZ2268610.1 outer membrane protein assembly factor [Ignavibacteriales bacterium]QKJ98108.1 MAG: hypothetical protein HND40_00325 [Ignavibacteriota bacterium]HOJ06746.1 hypothetical protein [Ignavibacteriaceae bacterium]